MTDTPPANGADNAESPTGNVQGRPFLREELIRAREAHEAEIDDRLYALNAPPPAAPLVEAPPPESEPPTPQPEEPPRGRSR